MKRIALLLVFVFGPAGIAAAAPATKVSLPGVQVIRSRPFPAQGLLLQRGNATIVTGLDDRQVARFVGVQPAWSANGDTARNEAFLELSQVLPDLTFLSGRGGRWYVLDPSGTLRLLTSARIRLPDGVDVIAHATRTDGDAFRMTATVSRAGRNVVPASAGLQRITGSLAVARSVAVDLATGKRWSFSPDCYPAGLANGELLMFCGPSGKEGSVELVSVSSTGSRRTLDRLPSSLYASGAYVSPDGKYVVGMFSPGCGPAYGFLVPTDGRPAIPLSGERTWSTDGPNSTALGWTTDGRIVARIQPTRIIDRDPKPAIYLIDPATLERTIAYASPRPWAMWNPARG